MPTHTTNPFQTELDALRTVRDELKLKAHLAKADLRQELATLETRWQQVEQDVRRTAANTKEPLQAIGQKLEQAVRELKQGFESVKSRMS